MPNKAIFRSAIKHLISWDSCQLEKQVGSGSNGAIWDLIACSWENFSLGIIIFFLHFNKLTFRGSALLALLRAPSCSTQTKMVSVLRTTYQRWLLFFFQPGSQGSRSSKTCYFLSSLSLSSPEDVRISLRITDHNMIFVWSAAVHLPQQTTAQQVQIKRGTIAGVQGRAKCADPGWIPGEEREGQRGVGQKPFLLRGVTTRII